jgi:hypothetical protein
MSDTDKSDPQLMEMESEMDENGPGAVFAGGGECDEEEFSDYGNPDMEGEEEEEGEFDEEENQDDGVENPQLEGEMSSLGDQHQEFKTEVPEFGGENPDGEFIHPDIKQELPDYDVENPEFEGKHLAFKGENLGLDEAGSEFEGGHSEWEGGHPDIEGENPDVEGENPDTEDENENPDMESENQDIEGDNSDFGNGGVNPDIEGENSDFVREHFEGAEFGGEGEDAEMEGSDFDEGEHAELDGEDEEYDDSEYPEMEDEDSRLEGDEDLARGEEDLLKEALSSPLETDKHASSSDNDIPQPGATESMAETAENDTTVTQSIGESSGPDVDNSSVPQISPKIEPPIENSGVEETKPPSPSTENAFSIRKSLDLTRSLSTLEWSSSASPAKRDLTSSPPGPDHSDDPRPTKRLKMQTMRTELDLKGSMMTRTWSELTNLLNDYQAELYQREDTLTSFENGDEKEILEEMSMLNDDLDSKGKLLSKCQDELSTKTERLKTVENELMLKTDELHKVKQELMTRNSQVKKFEFDIRYLKNEHIVKDNLLKKVQDQMVRETREMAVQIQSLREAMERERRLAQSYKDMMEHETKKRENAESRCRLLMSQSGGKAPVPVSVVSCNSLFPQVAGKNSDNYSKLEHSGVGCGQP